MIVKIYLFGLAGLAQNAELLLLVLQGLVAQTHALAHGRDERLLGHDLHLHLAVVNHIRLHGVVS